LQSCVLYTRLRVISGYKFASGTKRYRIFCLQYQPGVTKAGKARIYNNRGVMRRTISIDKIAILSSLFRDSLLHRFFSRVIASIKAVVISIILLRECLKIMFNASKNTYRKNELFAEVFKNLATNLKGILLNKIIIGLKLVARISKRFATLLIVLEFPKFLNISAKPYAFWGKEHYF